jgi:hypothetical protein
MSRSHMRTYFLTAAFLANACFAVAEVPPSNPARIKPPNITLLNAARAEFESQRFLTLALEVANPNDASLSYTGYTPDSFDPPLTAGHISPLYYIELKRDGKWEVDSRGYCGTGMANLELAARSSATFTVMIPTDEWQAVKVGIGHYPGWSNEETSTTTTWSTEITREAIETAASKSVSQAAPERNLPVGIRFSECCLGVSVSQALPERNLPIGKWTIKFANGVVETCEVCKDGSASVVEPKRTSSGKVCIHDGAVVIYFDDDRVERWTTVGERQVVEHWFPASQFLTAAPVLGIADSRD